EEGRVRAALARFLEWHYADPRELLGKEVRFSTVVELAGGERVELQGYADRVELDADGHVVVVDLKTSRRHPSHRSVQTHPQLALYQLAVDSGALDAELGARVAALGGEVPLRSGGGELVQLGALEDGPAVVQPQAPMPDDGADRATLRAVLADSAGRLRAEQFPAVPGQHCRDCAFVPICPARSAGSVIER
ncbi:MAG: PD-(D/E)XK nuclease family protein, partial [Marmoricola sp.]|nr:PD-(D/E)XK nuclease family protein [Marmoricola sp.]